MSASLDHFWRSVLEPLLQAAQAKIIVEIGSESGTNTRNLIRYARRVGGIIHSIDPAPKFDVRAWRMEYRDVLRLHGETSLDALPKIDEAIDAVLIDGDHNWYTVYHELLLLERNAMRFGRFPLTILHDVGWPYARRDTYADPMRIPPEYRHPFAMKGMIQSTGELQHDGGLNRQALNAQSEHAIHNGVLTAAEDFLKQSTRPLDWIQIPGIFGLGIIVDRSWIDTHPSLRAFVASLLLSDPLRMHLQEVEDERIRLQIGNADIVPLREQNDLLLANLVQQKTLVSALQGEKESLKTMLEDEKHRTAFFRFIQSLLRTELETKSTILERMLHSRSWRMTLWLRQLEQKLKRLFARSRVAATSASKPSAKKTDIVPALPATLIGCTIVSRNFLACARVLAESFCSHYPDARFFVLLVDAADGTDWSSESFTVVPIEDVPIPDKEQLCFRYALRELHTALKPYFLEWILRKHVDAPLVYLDPDILVENRLLKVEEALTYSSVVLTPHVLRPIVDGRRPSDFDVLRVGVFNLGFIGLSHTPVTFDFLRWWQTRVQEACSDEPDRNIFFDQRWMDLAPAIFSGVHILKDPACNVAYWNLHERVVESERGRFTVNGMPLVFFHFSGYRPDHPDEICKYDQSDRDFKGYPRLRRLFDAYRQSLLRHGHAFSGKLPYSFATFQNGIPIPLCIRRHFHSLAPSERMRFRDPFEVGIGSYWEWLHSGYTDVGDARWLTNAHHILWRSDQAFLQSFPEFGPAFAAWIASPDHAHRIPDFSPALFALAGRDAGSDRNTFLSSMFLRRNTFRVYRLCTGLARRMLSKRLFASIRERFSTMDVAPDRRPSVRLSCPFGINYSASFCDGTGVGQAARLNVLAADAAGIPLALNNIRFPSSPAHIRTDLQSRFRVDRPYDVNLIHMNADSIGAFIRLEGSSCLREHRSIAYWVWELSDFPAEWSVASEHFDEIWSPSMFSANAIRQRVSCPVHVVPHPVHVDGPVLHGRQDFGISADRFSFLFMFSCLSITERKNPFGVIDAFTKAFRKEDKVELVLKFGNAACDPSLRSRLIDRVAGHPIVLIDSLLTTEATHDLIRCCDVYVSLHRSEGFGLTMAEAMVCGKPVIATNYSGNTDYMNDQNSLLIDFNLIPLDRDYPPYRKGSQWADPDLDQAASAMRRLYEDRAFGQRLGEKAALDIRRTHSPAVIGALLSERITAEGSR